MSLNLWATLPMAISLDGGANVHQSGNHGIIGGIVYRKLQTVILLLVYILFFILKRDLDNGHVLCWWIGEN